MSLFCNIYDLEYYSVKKETRYIMKHLTKYFNSISTITFAICIILAIYGTITYKTGLLPVPWLIIPICTGLCFFMMKLYGKRSPSESYETPTKETVEEIPEENIIETIPESKHIFSLIIFRLLIEIS